jgi:hypothetical protein
MQPMHNAHPWLISTVCVLSDGSPGLPVFVVAPTGSNTGYVGNAAVTTVTQSEPHLSLCVVALLILHTGTLRPLQLIHLAQRHTQHLYDQQSCSTAGLKAVDGQSDGTLWSGVQAILLTCNLLNTACWRWTQVDAS